MCDPRSRPRIVITVGLPGSGKSSWLEKAGIAPLSSDHVRLLLADDATDQTLHARVFATLRYLLRNRLAIGRPVSYVDATHLTVAERKPYFQIAEFWGCEVEALYFETPLEVCRERNRLRARVVPDEALERMAGKLCPPTLREGFTRITVVNPRGETREG